MCLFYPADNIFQMLILTFTKTITLISNRNTSTFIIQFYTFEIHFTKILHLIVMVSTHRHYLSEDSDYLGYCRSPICL